MPPQAGDGRQRVSGAKPAVCSFLGERVRGPDVGRLRPAQQNGRDTVSVFWVAKFIGVGLSEQIDANDPIDWARDRAVRGRLRQTNPLRRALS